MVHQTSPESLRIEARRCRILRKAAVLGFDEVAMARLSCDLSDDKIRTLLASSSRDPKEHDNGTERNA